MKVLYELDLNDIIRIVAEKYGVPQEKVKKSNKDGLNYLMIDMSETETPGQVNFLVESENWEKVKAPEKKEEAEDDEADRYFEITDGIQEDYIKQGYTIPQSS